MDLLKILFVLAMLGLWVHLILRFIPMPDEFQTGIKIIAAVVVLLYLFSLFGNTVPNVLP
jgi:hypothetical protein